MRFKNIDFVFVLRREPVLYFQAWKVSEVGLIADCQDQAVGFGRGCDVIGVLAIHRAISAGSGLADDRVGDFLGLFRRLG